MSRIKDKFRYLKDKGLRGFIPYITAGDPDIGITEKLVLEFERRGADVIELGVPFSDPIADGPVNQAAAQRALKSGTTLEGILASVRRLRRRSDIPIVLFTYFNPVHRYGLEHFVGDAASSGVDGVLVVDLPPEEGLGFRNMMLDKGIDTIALVAPTSTDGRVKLISDYGTGFIYYVSRTGVTGERGELAGSIRAMVERIRRYTSSPVGVGFGVSGPDHVRAIARYADAVIVGSAIVRRIGSWSGRPDLVERVGDFVGELISSLKGEGQGADLSYPCT